MEAFRGDRTVQASTAKHERARVRRPNAARRWRSEPGNGVSVARAGNYTGVRDLGAGGCPHIALTH